MSLQGDRGDNGSPARVGQVSRPPLGGTSIIARLKKRKVVQWAIAYLAAAWLLLQVLDFLRENFGWSEITVRSVTVILAVGFLALVVVAWYHGGKGPQRLKPTELVVFAALGGVAVFGLNLVRRAAEASEQSVRQPTAENVLLDWQELPTYEAEAAAEHVGESAIVCGKVASSAYVPRLSDKPTFLNLENPYPNELLTVVIWEGSRAKFTYPPEVRFRAARICVAGLIEEYRGTPKIEVTDPGQIDFARTRIAKGAELP